MLFSRGDLAQADNCATVSNLGLCSGIFMVLIQPSREVEQTKMPLLLDWHKALDT